MLHVFTMQQAKYEGYIQIALHITIGLISTIQLYFKLLSSIFSGNAAKFAFTCNNIIKIRKQFDKISFMDVENALETLFD